MLEKTGMIDFHKTAKLVEAKSHEVEVACKHIRKVLHDEVLEYRVRDLLWEIEF